MAAGVNLDALIPREDFEVISEGDETPIQQTIQVRDLERTTFFYGALRKPDFQRETSEWGLCLSPLLPSTAPLAREFDAPWRKYTL